MSPAPDPNDGTIVYTSSNSDIRNGILLSDDLSSNDQNMGLGLVFSYFNFFFSIR